MGRGPDLKPRRPWLTRHPHVTGAPTWVYSIQVYRQWRSPSDSLDAFEYDIWHVPVHDPVTDRWLSPVLNIDHRRDLSVALVDMSSTRAKRRSRRRVPWSSLPDHITALITDTTTLEVINLCKPHDQPPRP